LEDIQNGHVIVAGYGRSGKASSRVLKRAGIPLVVIELSHAVFGGLAEDGFTGIWGDVTSEQILSAARVETARILLLTVPGQSTIHLSVERARRLNPTIMTIARAVGTDQVLELRKLGIDAVIQPEFEGGMAMVREALTQYGGCDTETARLVSEVRSELYGSVNLA
jgi:CPA2 family monovalent cation:H+ antiporter-2